MIKKLIAASVITIASSAYAGECDLTQPFFGSNSEQIISSYKLEPADPELAKPEKTGEFVISEMGKIVCDELPDESVMEFTFIDDNFVKIKIYTPNKSEELLQYAKKTFGENDDKDREKSANGMTNMALWGKNDKWSALYSNYKNGRGDLFESLDISSKLHQKLFEKISIQKGQDIDEYLKEKGLGVYAKGYKENKGIFSMGEEDKYDIKDAGSLKELQEKFKKSQDTWKKKNDAGKLGR